jgi:hypothetical protein
MTGQSKIGIYYHGKGIMKLLKVTMVEFYEIETTMQGNGWTEEQVIEDWFAPERINDSHVSREASKIGGTRILVDAEVTDQKGMIRAHALAGQEKNDN